MSHTVSLQQRLQQLKKIQADLPAVMAKAAHVATERAVEAATDATPPKDGTGRGPYIGEGTISGTLKDNWKEKSQVEPKQEGIKHVTWLVNDLEYASFVNDGHRMDRHFVPGLYINPHSGLIEYDEGRKDEVGMMVGTKTKYVKGEFMTDKAKAAYEETILAELDTEIRRLLE